MRIILLLMALVMVWGFANAATNVTNCTDIQSSGVYELNRTVSGNGTSVPGRDICINIDASNVMLDCKGFKLNSSKLDAVNHISYGIYTTGNNVTIKNCQIGDFYTSQISFRSTIANYVTNAYNNTIYYNGFVGDNDAEGVEIFVENGFLNFINNSIRTTGDNSEGLVTAGNPGGSIKLLYSQNNNITVMGTGESGESGYNFLGLTAENLTSINDTITCVLCYGVFIYNAIGGNYTFINSTINGQADGLDFGADIYMSGSNTVNLINATFNQSNTNIRSGGKMHVYWYLTLNITDFIGSTIPSVAVSIYNLQGVLESTGTGNPNGYFSSILEGYNVTSTNVRTNTTPHNFFASKTGYIGNSTNFTIDSSKISRLILTDLTISSCTTLRLPGVYTLNQSIATKIGIIPENNGGSDTACIEIWANDTVLDCNGFSINNNGTIKHGVMMGKKNETTQNCMIQNFTSSQILVRNYDSSLNTGNISIINNILTRNDPSCYGSIGISLSSSGNVFSTNISNNFINLTGCNSYGITADTINNYYLSNNRIFTHNPSGDVTNAGTGLTIGGSSSQVDYGLLVNNSIYTTTNYACFVENANLTIINSTFQGGIDVDWGVADFALEEGNIVFTNITFINSTLNNWTNYWVRSGDSKLSVNWYVNALITDSSNNPIPNAAVTLTNINGLQGGVFLTNSNGVAFLIAQEFYDNASYYDQTGRYNTTPHTISASASGYSANSTSLTITKSQQITLMLGAGTPTPPLGGGGNDPLPTPTPDPVPTIAPPIIPKICKEDASTVIIKPSWIIGLIALALIYFEAFKSKYANYILLTIALITLSYWFFRIFFCSNL